MKLFISLVFLMMIAFLSAGLVLSAGIEYPYGKPALSAAISGTDEYEPGTDISLLITVRNTGRDPELIEDYTVNPDQADPVTALGVTVTLEGGSAPVVIMGTSRMIGDLMAGESAQVSVPVRIPLSASSGRYDLNLRTSYRYIYASDETGTDTMQYRYRTDSIDIPLRFTIQKTIIPKIVSTENSLLYPGQEGYLNITIKNTGAGTGHQAVLELISNMTSSIRVIDGSVDIGSIGPGQEVSGKFRLKPDEITKNGSYPAILQIQYTDENNIQKTSSLETIGIPVGTGPKFSITSSSPVLSPGETNQFFVTYSNIGDETAFRAAARIIGTTLITVPVNQISLGDIAPGDSGSGIITIAIDPNAKVKSYGLTTDVRFRDKLDNLQLSEPLSLEVIVQKPDYGKMLVLNPAIGLTIGAVIILLIYGIYWIRKRKNE